MTTESYCIIVMWPAKDQCTDFQVSFKILHEIKMKGERSHKCIQCTKSVLTASDLRKHMLTHGDKIHKCNFCSYSATTGPYLKTHMNRHTREKQFICAECDKSFSESGSLSVHKRIHTGEKPYKCTLCKYTSAVAGNLKQHILRHTSEKPTLLVKAVANRLNPKIAWSTTSFIITLMPKRDSGVLFVIIPAFGKGKWKFTFLHTLKRNLSNVQNVKRLFLKLLT